MATVTIKTTTTVELESAATAHLVAELLRNRKDGSTLTENRSIYDLSDDVESVLDDVSVS